MLDPLFIDIRLNYYRLQMSRLPVWDATLKHFCFIAMKPIKLIALIMLWTCLKVLAYQMLRHRIYFCVEKQNVSIKALACGLHPIDMVQQKANKRLAFVCLTSS